MSNEMKDARSKAQEFVAANLAECCADEIEWQDTGLLRDGKLREAAKLFGALDKPHAIPLAQSETARQAMLRAATPPASGAEEPELPPLPNADGEIAKVRYWNISAMKDYARAAIAAQAKPVVMSDERIGAIFDELGGYSEFCKSFGYLQFARAILANSAPNKATHSDGLDDTAVLMTAAQFGIETSDDVPDAALIAFARDIEAQTQPNKVLVEALRNILVTWPNQPKEPHWAGRWAKALDDGRAALKAAGLSDSCTHQWKPAGIGLNDQCEKCFIYREVDEP
jgi:hypothetical protein